VPDRRASLLEAAVARGGVIAGAQAVSFVVQWTIAERDGGRRLGADSLSEGVREYSEWWRESERTSWRRLKRFRAVFGETADPRAYAQALQRAMDEREIRDVQAASASLGLAV
jgi:hypothetical protein